MECFKTKQKERTDKLLLLIEDLKKRNIKNIKLVNFTSNLVLDEIQ